MGVVWTLRESGRTILKVPAITWLFVIFGLLVLAGGFTAMAVATCPDHERSS
jgi:hypothetical protein